MARKNTMSLLSPDAGLSSQTPVSVEAKVEGRLRERTSLASDRVREAAAIVTGQSHGDCLRVEIQGSPMVSSPDWLDDDETRQQMEEAEAERVASGKPTSIFNV